jgi:hypothetical protein
MVFVNFKWLYNPDEPELTKRKIPPHNRNKRISKGKIHHAGLLTCGMKEICQFLKHFPNKRDKCYYAMALTFLLDLKILSLRIK